MKLKTKIHTALIPVALALVAALIVASRFRAEQPVDVEPQLATAARSATAAPASAPAIDASSAAPIVLAQADTVAATATRRFSLGTHYERLSPTQPTSSGPDKIEVAEIFWYGCPHCYTFDPYLESWKQALSADVSFVRLPALWNPALQLHARIYYTAEALGKLDEMHSAVFREMHVNRNSLSDPIAIRDFFGTFGVDAATFDKTFESFAVHTKIQRADELARRYRVSSVPTVIVNGKYTTNATMAGSYPDLLEVINELVAMERAGE
ncbi:MAG TPA: thiol:disulfide interchange protein DsbA/DsbL [Gammaproteobacteria bacterium]|nr:thiol:disulfide interchange protein DsbA/DsbL [Gammaproteobacteria bacterium]